MRKSFFLIFLFVFTISCNRENVVDVDTNYIGTWTSQDTSFFYTVKIDNDGGGEYQKTSSEANIFVTGKTKVWKDKIKIGSEKFDVNEAPNLLIDAFGNYFYRMQLDDIVYSRFI